MITGRIYSMFRSFCVVALVVIFSLPPQARVHASILTVTNTLDSGAGSLRWAVVTANSVAGPDTIEFDIPTSDPNYGRFNTGVFTIELTGPMIIVGDDTTIYGQTQTVNQGDTNPDGLEIEVWGGPGRTFPVFSIESDRNNIDSLDITGGSIGFDINTDADGTIINNSIIGLDADKLLAVGNIDGIVIRDQSDSNMIWNNTITGNIENGIEINNSNTNVIGMNSIGTTGSNCIHINGQEGILLTGTSSGNVIGGELLERNTISCNDYNGILVGGGLANTISYNFIGTDTSGTIDLGNGQRGIYVGGGADATEITSNLISGNTQSGVYIYGAGTDSTVVRGNTIGSDLGITSSLGNGGDGVTIDIGPMYTSVLDNVLVANGESGVEIGFSSYSGVRGNYIGISDNPAITGLGNSGHGVNVVGDYNTIGGDEAGRNYISSNGSSGVNVQQGSNNIVSYNYIGTDDSGELTLGNLGNGVRLFAGAQYNTIDHNLISANNGCGVDIGGDDVLENTISNNIIGSNPATTVALGNQQHGVFMATGAEDSLVQNNVIVASGWYGIAIYDTNGITVNGNMIGVGADPAIKTLGNHLGGVRLAGTATGNVIGGNSMNVNLISCNLGSGVWIAGAPGNEISHNRIGTDLAGTLDLGNQDHGVYVSDGAVDSIISNNLISGNGRSGVYILGSGTDRTSVTSNYIGSNYSALTAIGNGEHGVAVYDGPTDTHITSNVIVASGWSGLVIQNANGNFSSLNHIGIGYNASITTLGNAYYGINILGSANRLDYDIIAYNGLSHPANGDGIRVDGSLYSAVGNFFHQVSIFFNGGKGIENINGGNYDYMGPTLDPSSTCTYLSGAVPSGGHRYIQIYTGPDDEGMTFLGSTNSDLYGDFFWTGYIPGPNVSVTWTNDGDGSTSEFTTLVVPGCHHAYLPVMVKP